MTEVLPPETKAELSIPSLEIAGVTPSALDSMRSAFNAFYVEAKKWETQAMALMKKMLKRIDTLAVWLEAQAESLSKSKQDLF